MGRPAAAGSNEGSVELRIAVLYGGTSTERNVSLVSGLAVGLALADRGHDVLLVDPARGDAPVGPREAAAAAAVGTAPPPILHEDGSTLRAVAGEAVRTADAVFIALHGGPGEDGTVQGLLDLAGKDYGGSGVLGSALAMDKRVSKLIFREVGILTAAWQVLHSEGGSSASDGAPSFRSDLPLDRAAEAVDALGGYPIVVKPNDQGSTVGLSIVEETAGLEAGVALAAEYSTHVLLERYIPGREITVAVLGDDALPVVEIVPRSGFYDYEHKYTKGMSEYHCPADLPKLKAREIQEAGLAAFHALGCEGYARVDLRLSPEGRAYCLEVNTAPGMTEMSLVPMAAKAAGIGFGELVERILTIAMR
jgi:D-alanine-D-alanine ligase